MNGGAVIAERAAYLVLANMLKSGDERLYWSTSLNSIAVRAVMQANDGKSGYVRPGCAEAVLKALQGGAL